MITQDHYQALSKAKIQLMAKPDSAFFTTVCFSLKHIFSEDVSTAATNGRYIKFNPNFFMSLDTEERVFLLVHEAMHCAYLHMDRLMDREHRKWNIAADYVINLQLVQRGFKMPASGLLDRQYEGMSTEEVYKLLPDDSSAPCDMDLEPSNEPPEELQKAMEDILVQAHIQSKMANDKPGTIPGEIEIFLNKLLNPKLPWNRILQKYLNNYAKNDYTFKRPNRRFFPKQVMPSMFSKSLMNITIGVDTSGSVTDEEFLRFVTEVATILRMMKPEKITLIQFDTQIKSVTEIKSIKDLMECRFTGRGGTEVSELIDWATKHKPQLLMVFTDGHFRFYRDSLRTDCVWLIHNNPKFTSPFGKVIHYAIS